MKTENKVETKENKEQRNILRNFFRFFVPSDHKLKVVLVCNVILIFYLSGFLFNSDDSIILPLLKFALMVITVIIFNYILLYIGDLVCSVIVCFCFKEQL